MSDSGGEIGAFMAGFVVGGLVGAATALILAPQSGEETRAQIAAKGDEWRQYGEEHLEEYRSYAESTVGDVQERARIVLDEGKSKVSKKHPDDEEPDGEVESTDQELTQDDEEGDATE
jgi:gas vesicle protein